MQRAIKRAIPNAEDQAEYNLLGRTLPDATQVVLEAVRRAKLSPRTARPAFNPVVREIEGGSSTAFRGYGATIRARPIYPRQALTYKQTHG